MSECTKARSDETLAVDWKFTILSSLLNFFVDNPARTVHLHALVWQAQFDWKARPVDRSPCDVLADALMAETAEGNMFSTWKEIFIEGI